MIYAVGDIHGQNEKLRALLVKLTRSGLRPEDTLVFIGDYVDRGPDVAGVLWTLCELKSKRPNTVFLRGNHEQMMLDARQRFEPSFDAGNLCGNTESGVFWFAEGGQQTLESYGPPMGRRWMELVPRVHWDFMLSTLHEHNQGVYRFAHAGVLPSGVEWGNMEFAAEPRLWIRYEFIANESDFNGKTIVFGHTPTRSGQPLILWNKIGIDTGAGFGGPLTAVRLPDLYDPQQVEVFQV